MGSWRILPALEARDLIEGEIDFLLQAGAALPAPGPLEEELRPVEREIPTGEPLIAGEQKVAFGVTEPNAGLDTTSIETFARRAGDGYTDQVTRRDRLDSTRAVSPLVAAPGAFFVDTSKNTPQQTAALVLAELKRRGL